MYSIKLPTILKKYANTDFETQQRVRFWFYFFIASIISSLCLMLSGILVQTKSFCYNGIYSPVMIPQIVLFLFFILCFGLFIKGYLQFSIRASILAVFITIWYVMWVDIDNLVTKLDTIVYIIALLGSLQLFVTRHRRIIFGYCIVNIIVLFIFIWSLHLPFDTTLDYLIDTSIAMLFTGVAGYLSHKINKRTLDRALQEIEDRKKIEDKLKKSRNEFVSFASNVPGASYRYKYDKPMKLLFINDEIEKVSGYPASDFIRNTVRTYCSIIHKDDETRVAKTIEESIAQKKTWEIEYRIYHRDGSIHLIFEKGRATRESENGIKYIDGVIIDITERRRTEKSLHDRDILIKTIFDNSINPIVVLDPETYKCIDCNQAAIDIYQFGSHANALGKKTIDVSPEYQANGELSIDLGKKYVALAIEKGFVVYDWQHLLPDGTIIDAEIHLMSLHIDEKHVLQFTLIDRTEKKKTERELERYRNNLEQLVNERTEELETSLEELHSINEELFSQKEELSATISKLSETQEKLIQSEKMASLGILSAGIAHEINNPLNFIHGGITAIENYLTANCTEDEESLAPFIEAIHVGVKRASEIVSSLSHYSRQDNISNNDCDLHSIINNCLIMLQNQLKTRIDVETEFTEDYHLIKGNEGKLHQALINIITNAEQAIEGTGSIKIKTVVKDETLILTITDSGSGISPQNMQKIFDPFFTTKAPGKGTGLGLSITYKIISEHDGTIRYKSTPGLGTTVTIRFALKGTETATEGLPNE